MISKEHFVEFCDFIESVSSSLLGVKKEEVKNLLSAKDSIDKMNDFFREEKLLMLFVRKGIERDEEDDEKTQPDTKGKRNTTSKLATLFFKIYFFKGGINMF